MLFMCHQMAMERDAKTKRQNSTPSAPPTPILNTEIHYEVSSPIKEPIIWILGGPGCGKGTQCDKIVAKYKFAHFSTGDLLRAEVASGSEQGNSLQETMKTGGLVSNDTVLGLLKAAMVKQAGAAVGFLVDGYPREKDQGVAFEIQVAPVDIILYFECSNETMLARIMHRAANSAVVRADDNEETIKNRLTVFRTNVNEIIALYPAKTRTINAERPVEEIFADVEKHIDAMLALR